MEKSYKLHLISLLRHSIENDPAPEPLSLVKLFSDIVTKSSAMGDQKTLEFMYCIMLLLKSFMEDGDQ